MLRRKMLRGVERDEFAERAESTRAITSRTIGMERMTSPI